MECLAGEEEFLREFGSVAVVDEVEVEAGVGAVDFVTDDGVAEPVGVRADLVFASGFEVDFDEGKIVVGDGGAEVGDGGLRVGLGDGGFNVNRAGGVGAEGLVDGDGFGEAAGENGLVVFAYFAVLDGGLKTRGGFGVFGEEDDA